MRVISRFRDYYDGCRAWRDDNLTYVRGQKEIPRKEFNNEMKALLKPLTDVLEALPDASYGTEHTHVGVLGFCGKAYPLIYFTPYRYGPIEAGAYDTHGMEKILNQRYDQEKAKKYWNGRVLDRLNTDIALLTKTRSGRNYYGRYYLNHENWEKVVPNVNMDLDDNMFVQLGAPVMLLRDTGLFLNPCLKDLGFATQVDPYTAYQELSMYLGNNMAIQMDPNTDRSDELIRDQKGFDEWSFRKIGKKGRGR